MVHRVKLSVSVALMVDTERFRQRVYVAGFRPKADEGRIKCRYVGRQSIEGISLRIHRSKRHLHPVRRRTKLTLHSGHLG